jgi:signal transduction histidine kinase
MKVLSSLTNRVFVATASLVVVALALAIYRVGIAVASQAETDLRLGLAEAASLVDELNRTQFADFVVKAELIADLPVLRGAVATDDPPTIQPIAQEYQARMRADLFVVLGRNDRLLAQAGRVSLSPESLKALLAACRSNRDGTTFWTIPGGVLHVVAIPLDAGLSTLVVGSSLDEQTAARIHAVTNSEIAFVADSRIVASSLESDKVSALEELAGRTEPFAVTLGGEDYIGLVQSLAGPGEPRGPSALVLRSRTEHLRFLPTLRWHIAVTGVLVVLLATIVAYLVTRTVTRPLRALTGTMREMAATGDLTRSMPPLGRWDDEDVRTVASTFGQLTGALDRFRHEASLRERLSSLGQLSAVVAHEIRNPLMIIKSAVRRLRRSPEADVTAVAASIDEEVARLNRVVTDVLDFARPISVELGEGDVDQICREAAGAVQASVGSRSIVFHSSGPAVIVTDHERLRAVLVNVLTNAEHATQASGTDMPIAMSLSHPSAGLWRIVVADHGPGIAPEDLSRVFEPFFTTRRGGSGLGLAIARKIVEGLGGSIQLTSEPGHGTTVTIDITDRAAAREGSAFGRPLVERSVR